MIWAIGGTRTGKSNFVMKMVHRMPDKVYKIIVFNPVSIDEPLMNLLQEKIPETDLISDINELPSLSEFEEDKQDE